jgi:hypothetical protein
MNEKMTREYLSGRPEVWNEWLESGEMIEMTRYGKVAGITCKIGVTQDLYGEIVPFAEEAVKGISIEERVCEMIMLFVKACKFAVKDYLEFEYKISTKILDKTDPLKPKESREIIDKKLTVAAGMMIDDAGEPAILFTLK